MKSLELEDYSAAPDTPSHPPVLDLDATIRERHSTRMFLPQQPVPRALVDEALALAGSVIRNGYIEFHITVCQFGRLVRLVLSRHSTGSLRLVGWLRFRFQLAALASRRLHL